jgi:hypothetical protein
MGVGSGQVVVRWKWDLSTFLIMTFCGKVTTISFLKGAARRYIEK